MRNIEWLKRSLDYDRNVIFDDNENMFKRALREKKYDDLFDDCFAGDFGHCSMEGNRILAENIAVSILNELFGLRLFGEK